MAASTRVSLLFRGHFLLAFESRCTGITYRRLSTSNVPILRKLNVEFSDKRVQELLGSLAGMHLNKVFRRRREELEVPKYQLMTDVQLKQAQNQATQLAKVILEIPPVLEEREERREIIEEDPKLRDYDTHRHVFVDISMSASDKDRYIVVREIDGTLRQAHWEERDRMNQIYFPKEGRHLTLPKMLTSAHLPDVLQGESVHRHEEVLDLCNLQCEPDSPDYIRVHREVYADIACRGLYDVLVSTRHFGGLVWHLLRTDSVKGIAEHFAEAERMESLTFLSELYSLGYPEIIPTSVDESDTDTTTDSSFASSDRELEDLEERKQARLQAFMKHHGLEHCLDRIQKSASN